MKKYNIIFIDEYYESKLYKVIESVMLEFDK